MVGSERVAPLVALTSNPSRNPRRKPLIAVVILSLPLVLTSFALTPAVAALVAAHGVMCEVYSCTLHHRHIAWLTQALFLGR